MNDNHHSGNRPAPGHVWTATRQNPCGGSTKNQHKIINNGYNYLQCNDSSKCTTDDDDNATVKNSNKKKEKIQKQKGKIDYNEYGLMDSGTTNHFLTITSTCKNIRESKEHVNIVIPNGNKMTSTKE